MPHPATLASDADREHAVALLREHHAAGRLTADELGDRIAQAYRARTHADLGAVRAGLPSALPAPAAAAVSAPRGGYSGGQVAAAALFTVFVPIPGHLVGVVTSAVMLRDEQVPERRRMLRVWLTASITLLVIDAVLILLFVR